MIEVSMASVVDAISPEVDIDLEQHRIAVCGVESRATERRDLLRDLGTGIYSAFHVGNPSGAGVSTDRDLEYEESLLAHYSNRSTTRQVTIHDLSSDEAIVNYLGLRVRVPRAELKVSGQVAEMPIPLIFPALSPGFALARGPRDLVLGDPTVRVYFGAQRRGEATEIFHRTLAVLADQERWQAKVASLQSVYPRSDAVTVYLDVSEVAVIPRLLEATDELRVASIPRSWFARPISSGVGLAWEPQGRGVSFGQHRARVVAQILMARAEGSWRPEHLQRTCLDRGIDPDNIWRNPSSPDLDFLLRPAQELSATALGTP